MTAAGRDLFAVPVRGGALQRLTRDRRSSDPVWGPRWIAFARSRPAPAANDVPKLDVYLLDPSDLHLLRLTRTRPGFLLAGLSPVAFSADGLRLLAAFGGQDVLYAETISVRTGVRRRVGTRAQGLVGWGLSRDGASVLATTGGPDPTTATSSRSRGAAGRCACSRGTPACRAGTRAAA